MTDTDIARSNGEVIIGISSMATRRVLTELSALYEKQSGQRVAIEFVGGVDAAPRVEAGEAFDFVVLAASAIDKLAVAGRIDPHTRLVISRSRVAMAVPAGAKHPDLGSEQSLRTALLAVNRIGYSTGPSGEHLAKLLQRWGIADVIAPRMVKAPPGVPVGTLLARGEVDVGIQQLSELMDLPGVEVVGALPSEIQEITEFTGAVCESSTRREAARALLAFCASPLADATKRSYGMEP